MASIGQLVRVVAEVSGLDESSVKLIARYVREAGFIGQQSTGGGAARMTSKDAASLLMAVNGSALAKDAASAVDGFSRLFLHTTFVHELSDQLRDLKEQIGNDNFSECLSQLIEIGTSEIFEGVELKLEFERPGPKAHLFVWTSDEANGNLKSSFSFFFGEDSPEDQTDRNVLIRITNRSIKRISEVLSQ